MFSRLKKLAVFALAVVLLNTACKKDHVEAVVVPESSDKALVSLKFKAVNNPGRLTEDIICIVGDSTVTGVFPALNGKMDSLIATFEINGKEVLAGSVVQHSDTTLNDFTAPVTYTVKADNGDEKKYTVSLSQFTGLPIVYLTTVDAAAITSKEDYVNGHISINGNGLLFNSYEGDMQIRGRGNTTWDMPKKPYKIKLNSKAEILGMPADKEWALLANYSDKSLMRNYLAFETSKILELEYTPRYQFVEVFLNGTYVGNYQLGEHIKVATNRVNIKELDEDDISASKISGGYRLEVDARLDEPNWFYSAQGVPFTIKDPDEGVIAQNTYIQNYIQATEDAIYGSSFTDPTKGYAAYINPTTFINWFWVNELFKNNDALFHQSVLMYKDRDSLLKMGPVWDFDIAAGNIDYNGNDNPEGWWVKNAKWMSRLFEDKVFAQQAITRWQSVRTRLNKLQDKIDATAAYLKYSQGANFKTWDILNIYVMPNAVVTGSYDGEVAYLKSWLTSRINWIDAHLQELASSGTN
ncbi:CotH protein [Filimonas lacunae]|uniref:CotH protein n=1 Tax=Filimonas lacunae TaxID=477680 RepID=A0A173MRC8_9BACT|nr:CotH kinase family protein [Filimonas lacunae]BAV10214.1 hypothetical protein FLA_6274 [Filimonas lacunae]SIT18184.1 CotH protein [Filimonas lacunae]